MEVLTLILGVQDPESRRQARNSKRKDAESHFGSDVVDLVVDDDDDDDDFDSAPSKRRRL